MSICWKTILCNMTMVSPVLLTQGVRGSCWDLWELWSDGVGKWDRLSYAVMNSSDPPKSDMFMWDRVPLRWMNANLYSAEAEINDAKYAYMIRTYQDQRFDCRMYSLEKYNGNDGLRLTVDMLTARTELWSNLADMHRALSCSLMTLCNERTRHEKFIITHQRLANQHGFADHDHVAVSDAVMASTWAYMCTDRLDIAQYLTRVSILLDW